MKQVPVCIYATYAPRILVFRLNFLVLLKQRLNTRYGIKRHFQQYFSYIVAVSCICEGNQKKQSTCRKSLANVIKCCIQYTPHERSSNSRPFVVIGTDCIGSCIPMPPTIRSRPRRPRNRIRNQNLNSRKCTKWMKYNLSLDLKL